MSDSPIMPKKRSVTNNCEKATFLIEKKQFTLLSSNDSLGLRLHLAGCPECRTYLQQSVLINEISGDLFSTQPDAMLSMDEAFKKKMQAEILKWLQNRNSGQ
jgi:hypothetical protein